MGLAIVKVRIITDYGSQVSYRFAKIRLLVKSTWSLVWTMRTVRLLSEVLIYALVIASEARQSIRR